MGTIGWYIVCILGGISLDWGFMERFSTIIEALIKRNPALTYRSGLLPRIIVTILGTISFAYGTARGSPPNMFFFVGGVALFLLSLTWGLFISFRDNETGA